MDKVVAWGEDTWPHRNGRLASDIMHELAHLIIGHEPARVDVTEDGLLILNTFSQKQEDEAKWLSGCLLLPRPALLAIRARDWRPPKGLALAYRCSLTECGCWV